MNILDKVDSQLTDLISKLPQESAIPNVALARSSMIDIRSVIASHKWNSLPLDDRLYVTKQVREAVEIAREAGVIIDDI
jgi:hypothetical protein